MEMGLRTDGGERIALLGVEVKAELVAGHVAATLRQRYRNDEPRAIEAVYTFPLPTRGLVTGFVLEVAGQRLEASVEERAAAFERYEEALVAGHGAALLEQERPNVFTANVGNLRPGEETTIAITWVEPLGVDEGGIRWSLPTLVAPRFAPAGVADADRVSPPIGAPGYGLVLEAVVDLGALVDVESPSHSIATRRDGSRVVVTLADGPVPLDRDLVLTAFPRESATGPVAMSSSVCHRVSGAKGTFALTLVPDLAKTRRPRPTDVVFLLDRSGSMGGVAMREARTALRLCLRQLREGDRFAILAFDNVVERFAPTLVPFTQRTLLEADAFLDRVEARGGTVLLEPLVEAARLAPDGMVVLLTDGQVANEDAVLAAFLGARKTARVFALGIGTNVSDALLAGLADRTGGAVESIHPGERIDEKVVAQFARATAPRVTDVTIALDGAAIGELAPATPRPLVDGEPWVVFGTYTAAGAGLVTVRGTLDGEPFYLETTLFLEDTSSRPVVERLWAQARIRDLETTLVGDRLAGRRADALRARIVDLAKQHRCSSRFTSFVVVEERTGDRREHLPPETRVEPVHGPAGWSLVPSRPAPGARAMPPGAARAAASMAFASRPGAGGFGGLPGAGRAPGPAGVRPSMGLPSLAAPPARGAAFDAPPPAPAPAPAARGSFDAAFEPPAPSSPRASTDPVLALLERQEASGLWSGAGGELLATAEALLALLDHGVTATHPVHGAVVKKALEAIVRSPPAAPSRAVALAVAWLVAGRRTKHEIEATGARSALDEPALRAEVARLRSIAPPC